MSNVLSNVNTGSKYPRCCTKWVSLGRIRINAGLEMKYREEEEGEEKEDSGEMSLEKRGLIKADIVYIDDKQRRRNMHSRLDQFMHSKYFY